MTENSEGQGNSGDGGSALQLLSSPRASMTAVRQGGWAVPVLCLSATYALICSIPWPSPDMRLMVLKVWSVYHLLIAASLWGAGLPMGGRGSIGQAFKITALLSVLDGAGLCLALLFFPPGVQIIRLLLPVMHYLAIKALHEYDNDNWSFKVLMTFYSLLFFLAAKLLPLLGVTFATWGHIVGLIN